MTPEVQIILQELRREIAKTASPWAGRQQAAAYCDCSVSTLDAAANAGKVKRRWRDSEPVFLKKDLDKWVKDKKL